MIDFYRMFFASNHQVGDFETGLSDFPVRSLCPDGVTSLSSPFNTAEVIQA